MNGEVVASERRYEIPGVLQRMAHSQSWAIAVIFRDGSNVEVECGEWGHNGGWIRYSYWYDAAEITESVVAKRYPQAAALTDQGRAGEES